MSRITLIDTQNHHPLICNVLQSAAPHKPTSLPLWPRKQIKNIKTHWATFNIEWRERLRQRGHSLGSSGITGRTDNIAVSVATPLYLNHPRNLMLVAAGQAITPQRIMTRLQKFGILHMEWFELRCAALNAMHIWATCLMTALSPQGCATALTPHPCDLSHLKMPLPLKQNNFQIAG